MSGVSTSEFRIRINLCPIEMPGQTTMLREPKANTYIKFSNSSGESR
jgi:hypothetical protein